MTTQATVIALRADIQGLQSDMQRAVGIVDSASKTIKSDADKTFKSLKSEADRTFRTAVGAVFGAGGILGLRAIAGQLREFETLKASLKTVTGSSNEAEQALQWIERFAAQTPFALEEVIGAFVKLSALGLEPSEAALRSYGNTASAMGKSLDQFVEAVADAATGEFERLKEFGVRSATEGDRVTFTFRGMSTTVQKEAAAIERYLRQIGDVEFGGAMAERAATIDGAFSNLGDSFKQLVTAVGDAGLTVVLADAARAMATLANEAARAVKETGKLTSIPGAIGSGIAEILRGSDAQVLSETELRIDELERRAAALRRLGGVRSNMEAATLEGEIARLQQTRDGLRVAMQPEAFGGAAARPRTAAEVAGAGGSLDRPKTTEEKAAERAAAALAKREAEAIRQLALRVVAENDATEATRIRFEIESGAYKQFTAAGKERLAVLADELDLQRESAEVQEYLRDVEQGRREDAEKARQAFNTERQKTIESLRTPEEQYAGEVRRLLSLGLDDQNLQRGIDAARDSMQGALEKTNETSEAIRDLGLTFESAFESAILGGESLSEVMQGLARDIAAIGLRKFVTEPLIGGIASLFSGGGGGGGGGGFSSAGGFDISSLFGNSRGGLYKVDGGGGAERPIAFTARAGEFVAVGTRMTSGGGGSNVHVEIINNTGAAARQEDMGVIDGEQRIRVIIGDMVDERLGSAGGARALQRGYGLMPRTVNR